MNNLTSSFDTDPSSGKCSSLYVNVMNDDIFDVCAWCTMRVAHSLAYAILHDTHCPHGMFMASPVYPSGRLNTSFFLPFSVCPYSQARLGFVQAICHSRVPPRMGRMLGALSAFVRDAVALNSLRDPDRDSFDRLAIVILRIVLM